MRVKVIVILGVCLMAATCRKREYPEEKVQLKKEDMYFSGSIGNEPVSLAIGKDGYYCYSSFRQGADSLYAFEGELRKFDCNPCPLSLKLDLFDYRQSLPDASVNADSSLRTGSRKYAPAIARPYTIRFESHSNKQIAAISWKLSNGASSQDAVMTYEFSQPGPQTVSLTVRTTQNCESRVVNTIFVGENALFACGIAAETVQNTLTKFEPAVVGGKGSLSYSWNFGDGGNSTLEKPQHEFKWSGSYPVTLRIQDAEGHVCESRYIHVAGNDQSSCAANMSLSLAGRRNALLNGVKIRWTDASNIALRSDSIVQPAESYFEVVNSQPYEANERGETGRLLTLRFNVLLSGGGRKLWFKSENTALAVTYK